MPKRLGLVLVLMATCVGLEFVPTTAARTEIPKIAAGRYHPGTGSFIGEVHGGGAGASVYVHGIARHLEFASDAEFEVEGELMPSHPPNEKAVMIPFTARMLLSLDPKSGKDELRRGRAKFYHVRIRHDRI